MRIALALALVATVSVACAAPSNGTEAGGSGRTSASATQSVSTAKQGPSAAGGSTTPSGPSPTTVGGGGGSSDSCSGFAISLARGVKGKATPAQAFRVWLAGKPDGFDPDPTAWHVASHIAGKSVRYEDGKAHVFVVHVDPSGSGWIVMSGSSCA